MHRLLFQLQWRWKREILENNSISDFKVMSSSKTNKEVLYFIPRSQINTIHMKWFTNEFPSYNQSAWVNHFIRPLKSTYPKAAKERCVTNHNFSFSYMYCLIVFYQCPNFLNYRCSHHGCLCHAVKLLSFTPDIKSHSILHKRSIPSKGFLLSASF